MHCFRPFREFWCYKVTKEDYEQKLGENLTNLVKRMKSGGYRPNPTRKVYILKETKGKMRPLGCEIISFLLIIGLMRSGQK